MIIRPEAEDDMDEAWAYYEGRREGLGDEFLAAVRVVLKRAEVMPEIHPTIRGDVRRGLVRKYSFAVYYRIVQDEVIVIGVMSTRRDPRHWQSRN